MLPGSRFPHTHSLILDMFLACRKLCTARLKTCVELGVVERCEEG